MTPPTAVAGRRTGSTLPRRTSGATRTAPPRARAAERPPRERPQTPAPARIVRGVLDAPLLDRLVRGSGWIPLVAAGLMGIVFMQVSMLKLNAGIGRAVQTAATLERQNSELRRQVSGLDGNQRIESIARRQGLVVPAAGSFRYVTARPGRTDAREAARGITPPDPVQPGSSQPAAPVTPVTPVTPPAAVQQTPAATPVTPVQHTPAATPTAAPAQAPGATG